MTRGPAWKETRREPHVLALVSPPGQSREGRGHQPRAGMAPTCLASAPLQAARSHPPHSRSKADSLLRSQAAALSRRTLARVSGHTQAQGCPPGRCHLLPGVRQQRLSLSRSCRAGFEAWSSKSGTTDRKGALGAGFKARGWDSCSPCLAWLGRSFEDKPALLPSPRLQPPSGGSEGNKGRQQQVGALEVRSHTWPAAAPVPCNLLDPRAPGLPAQPPPAQDTEEVSCLSSAS